MEEIWEDIIGYTGLYQISNYGKIRSLNKTVIYSDGRVYKYKQKILKITHVKNKYPTVHLYDNNHERSTFLIHRLVAETFIPNPENKATVNHKDGNKYNNCVENLEWATYKENNNHAIESGLTSNPKGIKSKLFKLSHSAYLDILENCKKGVRGFSCNDFAKKYGVSPPTVQKIINTRGSDE